MRVVLGAAAPSDTIYSTCTDGPTVSFSPCRVYMGAHVVSIENQVSQRRRSGNAIKVGCWGYRAALWLSEMCVQCVACVRQLIFKAREMCKARVVRHEGERVTG